MSDQEIDLLLTCGHIVIEDLEGVLYVPSQGAQRICNVCHKDVQIFRVGTPMYKQDVKKRKEAGENKKGR